MYVISPPIKSISISKVSVHNEITLVDEMLVVGSETVTDSLGDGAAGESGSCVGISVTAVFSGGEINGTGLGAGAPKSTTWG